VSGYYVIVSRNSAAQSRVRDDRDSKTLSGSLVTLLW